MRNISFIVSIFLVSFYVGTSTGCATLKNSSSRESTTEKQSTEKISQRVDSVFYYRHDSTFIRQNGDTVRIYEYHNYYNTKYLVTHDTLHQRDTVKLVTENQIVKEVKNPVNYRLIIALIITILAGAAGWYLKFKK
ncbi:MAG: hypothetical protein LBN95_13750 [Prevotellaceae bacterium]|nr:hypothetical protein [Prevotellaceae bacterium]